MSFGGGVGESTHPAPASVPNEALLAEGLERLAAATPAAADLIETFGAFVRTADDDALVRINPIAFAERHGLPSAAVIELFLHARKLGLLAMEWQYVCPGCGEIVERLTSLTSATAHYFCQVCSADRDTDLSNFVEVTFSVSPNVRRSPYHDPWSLTPEEHFFRYRFTQSGSVADGSSLRDHLRANAQVCAYVEPGATETFSVTAEPAISGSPTARRSSSATRRRTCRARSRSSTEAYAASGSRPRSTQARSRWSSRTPPPRNTR